MKNRFDEASKTWDENPVTKSLSQAINSELDSRIVFSKNMNVLDYGAGTGLMLFHVQPKVQHVTAIDSSVGMRDVIKQKIEDADITNVSVLDTNIEKDVLLENMYDVIVSSMTLHHIKNTKDFFSKTYSALKQGGKIAIVDLVTEDGTFHKTPDDTIFHLGFEPLYLEELMKELGYKDVSVAPFYSIFKEGKEYPVLMAVGTK